MNGIAWSVVSEARNFNDGLLRPGVRHCTVNSPEVSLDGVSRSVDESTTLANKPTISRLKVSTVSGEIPS